MESISVDREELMPLVPASHEWKGRGGSARISVLGARRATRDARSGAQARIAL